MKAVLFCIFAFGMVSGMSLLTGEIAHGSSLSSAPWIELPSHLNNAAIAPLGSVVLSAASSLPRNGSPRTLLNSADITRMKNWAATYPWAAAMRDEIVSNANAWPSKYLCDYNLTSPDFPQMGGHPYNDYLCPDGTYLQYVPTHSPPHYCPSTNQYYTSPPQWPGYPALYDQVIYGRRHSDLAQYAMFLGLAYQLTGNNTYAMQAGDIIRQYAATYLTYPLHTGIANVNFTASAARVHDGTLNESIWLINLVWSCDLIVGSGVLSAADQIAIANGLLRPATTIIKGNNMGLANHQIWHNAAMAITALVLDDPAQFADTFTNPNNGFFYQLAQGASADGLWWEGSWHYHFFALPAVVFMAEMGARNGVDAYAGPNLRKMFSVPLQMATPDLNLPSFNDGDANRTYSLTSHWNNWVYEAGYNRYLDPDMVISLVRQGRFWQGLLWGVASLPTTSSTAPSISVLLSQAGYAVLRAGSDNPCYIAFDFGPHGGGHGHYDKLGYISYSLGKTLGTDPSSHSFASDLRVAWDKTTVAHNAVVVDEQNQGEATGNLQRYLGLPALSLATADAGGVYPGRATITRTLVLNADYWLDVTRAATLDGNTHQYDWVYHNPGELTTSLAQMPYASFPTNNGFNFLTNSKSATTSADWQVSWNLTGVGKSLGYIGRSNDSIVASYTLTDQKASGGYISGQMDYDFGTITNGWIVYTNPDLVNIPHTLPTSIDVMIYGDGSKNGLSLQIVDATGEAFGKWATNISWSGWRKVQLPIDTTWWHDQWGDHDGVIDLPITRVQLSLESATGAAHSGRLFADDFALTFPSTGRQVVENFDGQLGQMRMTMLGYPNTLAVLGNGIDATNQAIPFAMARRQAKNTTFAAVFEPYRQSPLITALQALPMSPSLESRSAFRISAPGAFADTIALSDDNLRGDRTFGGLATDAAVSYIRQDAMSNLQTLALVDSTNLMDGSTALFISTTPITLQILYNSTSLNLSLPTMATAQVRLYSPTSKGVVVNNKPTPAQRDGQYLIISLPPNPNYLYLPFMQK